MLIAGSLFLTPYLPFTISSCWNTDDCQGIDSGSTQSVLPNLQHTQSVAQSGRQSQPGSSPMSDSLFSVQVPHPCPEVTSGGGVGGMCPEVTENIPQIEGVGVAEKHQTSDEEKGSMVALGDLMPGPLIPSQFPQFILPELHSATFHTTLITYSQQSFADFVSLCGGEGGSVFPSENSSNSPVSTLSNNPPGGERNFISGYPALMWENPTDSVVQHSQPNLALTLSPTFSFGGIEPTPNEPSDLPEKRSYAPPSILAPPEHVLGGGETSLRNCEQPFFWNGSRGSGEDPAVTAGEDGNQQSLPVKRPQRSEGGGQRPSCKQTRKKWGTLMIQKW